MSSPEILFQQILQALPQVLTDARAQDLKTREAAERAIAEWTNNYFVRMFMFWISNKLLTKQIAARVCDGFGPRDRQRRKAKQSNPSLGCLGLKSLPWR